MKIFISYSWEQSDWVVDYLLPIIDASGHEAIIDRRHFRAGISLPVQMDQHQDDADKQLLLFSKAYMKSGPCQKEMCRALVKDPGFLDGLVVPLVLEKVTLPTEVTDPNPLYIRFRDGKAGDKDGWTQLCQSLGLDVGCHAYDWLIARDRIDYLLGQNQSVNLIANGGRARTLLGHLEDRHGLPKIDFNDGRTTELSSLAGLILEAAGLPATDIPANKELVVLTSRMLGLKPHQPSRQLWHHFQEVIDHTGNEDYRGVFNRKFAGSLRHLLNTERRLVILAVSTTEIGGWLESTFDSPTSIDTVKLG